MEIQVQVNEKGRKMKEGAMEEEKRIGIDDMEMVGEETLRCKLCGAETEYSRILFSIGLYPFHGDCDGWKEEEF